MSQSHNRLGEQHFARVLLPIKRFSYHAGIWPTSMVDKPFTAFKANDTYSYTKLGIFNSGHEALFLLSHLLVGDLATTVT